jgi:predicted TIM-barrel fold metal-dependent hydrolase
VTAPVGELRDRQPLTPGEFHDRCSHLGETLPFAIWRIDHRVSYQGDRRRFDKPLMRYFQENFYVTTSGNFRTQALNATLAELGADRVLFSVDYPLGSNGRSDRQLF